MIRKIATVIVAAGVITVAFCQGNLAPLVAFPREACEGMVWDMGSVSVGNQTFTGSLQGLGSGPGAIQYKLDGDWEVLEAHLGYTKNTSTKRACKFIVEADKGVIYTSGEIHGGQEPEFMRVSVEGQKNLILRIQPLSYGATFGAVYANPVLKRGLTAEQKVTPYIIEVNGVRVPYDQASAPAVLPVTLPVKPGENTYQVKITHDPEKRRVEVKTSP